MLVTLEPLDRNGWKDFSPGIGNGARCAYHLSPCKEGEACVRFVSSRRLYNGMRRKICLRNVVAVLRHEEIHHVLGKIGEDLDNRFDDLHKDYYDVCRILNCSNHQVT